MIDTPATERWGLRPLPLESGGFVTILVEYAGSDAMRLSRLGHQKDMASTWLSGHSRLESSCHIVRKLNLAHTDTGTALVQRN